MNLPVIRIKDAWLLRENASAHLNTLWGEGAALRSDKEYAEITQQYIDAWQPYEKQILEHMCDILGLEFRQNIIDVYIAPWFYAFSDPIVIGVASKPDEFIDILTHELIHKLLIDNSTVQHDSDLLNPWQKLFGEKHSFTTLIHIPVHAIHKSIYLDLLKASNRLERDIASNKKNGAKDYLDSWKYVNMNSYTEIISSLKDLYKSTTN